jgi:hypothetical protein
MTIRLLGRLFFPNQQEWKRQQKAKHLVIACGVGVLYGAAMLSIMYFKVYRR